MTFGRARAVWHSGEYAPTRNRATRSGRGEVDKSENGWQAIGFADPGGIAPTRTRGDARGVMQKYRKSGRLAGKKRRIGENNGISKIIANTTASGI